MNYILDKIQKGIQPLDQMITEAQICRELNMSRTPVREALIELAANGVLEKHPRRGFKIKHMDRKHKMDMYVILGNLDALAARLATEYLDMDDFKKMNEVIDLIDIAIKYENFPSYYDKQEEFHQIYIRKCKNDHLKKMISEIKSSVTNYTYVSDDMVALFQICKKTNSEHRRIVEIFEEKNAEKVEKYLVEVHWDTKDFDMI